jgi:hypothetical protein
MPTPGSSPTSSPFERGWTGAYQIERVPRISLVSPLARKRANRLGKAGVSHPRTLVEYLKKEQWRLLFSKILWGFGGENPIAEPTARALRAVGKKKACGNAAPLCDHWSGWKALAMGARES